MNVFWAGEFECEPQGYPVRQGSGGICIAVFVEELEARDYARYRNERLERTNTTSVTEEEES